MFFYIGYAATSAITRFRVWCGCVPTQIDCSGAFATAFLSGVTIYTVVTFNINVALLKVVLGLYDVGRGVYMDIPIARLVWDFIAARFYIHLFYYGMEFTIDSSPQQGIQTQQSMSS